MTAVVLAMALVAALLAANPVSAQSTIEKQAQKWLDNHCDHRHGNLTEVAQDWEDFAPPCRGIARKYHSAAPATTTTTTTTTTAAPTTTTTTSTTAAPATTTTAAPTTTTTTTTAAPTSTIAPATTTTLPDGVLWRTTMTVGSWSSGSSHVRVGFQNARGGLAYGGLSDSIVVDGSSHYAVAGLTWFSGTVYVHGTHTYAHNDLQRLFEGKWLSCARDGAVVLSARMTRSGGYLKIGDVPHAPWAVDDVVTCEALASEPETTATVPPVMTTPEPPTSTSAPPEASADQAAVEAAAEEMRAQAAEKLADAAALDALADDLQAEASPLAAEAADKRERADKRIASAEKKEAKAQKRPAQADRLLSQAASLRESAGELNEQAAGLQASADRLMRQADDLLARADVLRALAAKLSASADALQAALPAPPAATAPPAPTTTLPDGVLWTATMTVGAWHNGYYWSDARIQRLGYQVGRLIPYGTLSNDLVVDGDDSYVITGLAWVKHAGVRLYADASDMDGLGDLFHGKRLSCAVNGTVVLSDTLYDHGVLLGVSAGTIPWAEGDAVTCEVTEQPATS